MGSDLVLGGGRVNRAAGADLHVAPNPYLAPAPPLAALDCLMRREDFFHMSGAVT